MRMTKAGHLARMGEMINAYKILAGKPEGKRPLGRHGRKYEDNIKIDIREIGIGGVDWIHLAQDRVRWLVLANTVMKQMVQ
jgi:hypothetical protein